MNKSKKINKFKLGGSMKKSIFNRLAIFVGCVVFLALTLATSAPAQSGGSGNVKTSIAPVLVIPTLEVVPTSGSSLSRNNNGVFFTFSTTGLTPGTVVTAWLGIFNNPQYCATTPCTPADFGNPDVEASVLNAGGKIIGADGAATYGAYRAVGDTTGAFFGPGLLYAKRAQVDLVLRSHGLASLDPDILNQQLTTFNGGCPPNPCVSFSGSFHLP